MHKGTLFLLILLIVILASSMVFGNYGSLEGLAIPAQGDKTSGMAGVFWWVLIILIVLAMLMGAR